MSEIRKRERVIYVIEHPDKTFKGFLAGVDYHNGKGSTSSIQDARVAQERGHVIRDRKGKRLFIRRSFDAGRENLTSHDTPVEDAARAPEPQSEYVNYADRRQRERTARKLSVL